MTPLFWISVTWVLAATAVGRLPLQQRTLPGAVLALAAVPIILSLGIQVGWLMALLGVAAVISCYPNIYRLALARWRGEKVHVDANVLRFLVIPGEI
ncbi:MAG: DUF2484 family protein [Sulfitobacter sp.]